MEVADLAQCENNSRKGVPFMRILMILVLLTVCSVVAIDHFSTKKSPLEDENWLSKEPLIRFEVGNSCPLYYPEKDS